VTAATEVDAPATVRLAEVLAALSLATDAGNGFPLEKSLRNAVIAVRLGEQLDLAPAVLSDVFYVALLRSIGCTAYAHETAALLGGDDVAFHGVYERLDPGHPAELLRDVVTGIGAWAPPVARARAVATFLSVGARKGREAAASACEVSVSLAYRLALSPGVAEGLDQVYERFDGRGGPAGLRGERLCLPARITHLADIAGIAHLEGGDAAAREAVARRRGGHFDPALADAFGDCADEVLAGLEADDMLEAALAAEPPPRASFPRADLERFAAAFGDFADLKSPWTLGHSRRVARLAGDAAPGAEHRDALVLAGHLHDLGRAAVPNGIWDKPKRLGAAEWERVRLHPYYTERILARTRALAPLAPLAGAHHERLDGSGYHRGLQAPSLTRPMRVLAAADVYAAMTADRPHRRALDAATVARDLRAEADAGRLDAEAVEAVLAAAGHAPARRRAYPCELTEREVEVLRLLALGLTNKEIAARLVVSPRTVQHHVAHIYPKIGRRSRAGAALFAMEHGLAEDGAARGE
jgi:HD-GYP domain-containing protein (c-di-GMP phosphodiesterase class II)